MKEWPKPNYVTVSYSDLVDPLLDALKHFYNLELKEPMTDFQYEGYNIGKRELVTCLTPKQVLTAEFLQWHAEDQGREPVENIIHLVFLMGIEQGRRILLRRFWEIPHVVEDFPGLERKTRTAGDELRKLVFDQEMEK